MALIMTPNLDAADDFYAALLAAHADLSDEEMAALNARLVLVLANHIGRHDVLMEAIALAKAAGKR